MEPDVLTTAERTRMQAYALGIISRDPSLRPDPDPVIDEVLYWYGEYGRPQSDSCKEDAHRRLADALTIWRTA